MFALQTGCVFITISSFIWLYRRVVAYRSEVNSWRLLLSRHQVRQLYATLLMNGLSLVVVYVAAYTMAALRGEISTAIGALASLSVLCWVLAAFAIKVMVAGAIHRVDDR